MGPATDRAGTCALSPAVFALPAAACSSRPEICASPPVRGRCVQSARGDQVRRVCHSCHDVTSCGGATKFRMRRTLLAEPRAHHLRHRLRKVSGPIVHERPALGEQIAAPVRCFHRRADRVRKRLLHTVVGMMRCLGGPVGTWSRDRARSVRLCPGGEAVAKLIALTRRTWRAARGRAETDHRADPPPPGDGASLSAPIRRNAYPNSAIILKRLLDWRGPSHALDLVVPGVSPIRDAR